MVEKSQEGKENPERAAGQRNPGSCTRHIWTKPLSRQRLTLWLEWGGANHSLPPARPGSLFTHKTNGRCSGVYFVALRLERNGRSLYQCAPHPHSHSARAQGWSSSTRLELWVRGLLLGGTSCLGEEKVCGVDSEGHGSQPGHTHQQPGESTPCIKSRCVLHHPWKLGGQEGRPAAAWASSSQAVLSEFLLLPFPAQLSGAGKGFGADYCLVTVRHVPGALAARCSERLGCPDGEGGEAPAS